ncbi:hypothetical protein HZB78_04560 [Candidatus Collierbacteria bacterium]|nr:hypothetical protein [Candidatus Collierbacteria bacterium]
MSKRGWIIAGIIVLTSAIGFAVATYFISGSRQKTPLVSPENKASTLAPLAVPTAVALAEKVYEDGAGFSFSYPGDLTVSDQTPDDSVHYSLVYLKNQSGETTRIRVKDKEKEVPPDSKSSKTLTLGGMKAEYYESPVKLTTLAINQNILYEIVSPNTAYWKKVHQAVVESFSTGTAVTGNNQNPVPAGNTTYEAEEVVE